MVASCPPEATTQISPFETLQAIMILISNESPIGSLSCLVAFDILISRLLLLKLSVAFLFQILLSCLLFPCSLITPCIASAQSQVSLQVPNLLSTDRPDPFDAAAFEPHETVTETIYPLSPIETDAPPKRKSKQPASPAAPPDLRFRIEQSGKASGVFGGDAHAERNVIVKVTDVTTGRVATLYADVVDYNSKTGIITASGGANPPSPIRLVSEEGTLSGDNISYNLLENNGLVNNATMTADTFRLHGKTVEAKADGSYVAHDAMFTTCVHGSLDGAKGYPDYRVAAKDLTLYPGKYVSAKQVTVYFGRTKRRRCPP